MAFVASSIADPYASSLIFACSYAISRVSRAHQWRAHHLRPVGIERNVLVIKLYRFGVELDSRSPVVLFKGLVSLFLQGDCFVGSRHVEDGRLTEATKTVDGRSKTGLRGLKAPLRLLISRDRSDIQAIVADAWVCRSRVCWSGMAGKILGRQSRQLKKILGLGSGKF